MQVFRFQEKPAAVLRSVVTIGNFDGIHLGHRALIGSVIQEARERGCSSALVTFDPHPQEVIHLRQPVPRISSSDQKLLLLKELGLDEVHIIPFTDEFSKLSAEEFAQRFLIRQFDLKKLVIGYDFRFGKHRAGDFKLLECMSQKFNFALEEVPPVQQNGQTVSSTLIRQMIHDFRFSDIPDYLGRGYSLYGKVESGDQRGRKLGFPTANLQPRINLALPNGVYVTRVILNGKTHFGVTNVGVRPTFEKNGVTIETWIFDFDQEIYGEYLEVFPLCQLRAETKFASIDELTKQIGQDIEMARNYLTTHEFYAEMNKD